MGKTYKDSARRADFKNNRHFNKFKSKNKHFKANHYNSMVYSNFSLKEYDSPK